jgi:hypothetical protein
MFNESTQSLYVLFRVAPPTELTTEEVAMVGSVRAMFWVSSYAVFAGQSLLLDATPSWDKAGLSLTSFEWDINGDAKYDRVTYNGVTEVGSDEG